MAIARLSVKVGKAGKAAAHAEYIAREGQYSSRLEKGEVLEATEAGNMPAWAAANPAEFWRAADVHERANGTTYREFEVALPRELVAEDRAALVRAFVAQELADKHAYQWAIHRPKAADGQDQPHAHIMFSERKRDGIERDPATYFKRWNAKAPEKGGARKRFGLDTTNRSQAERTAELAALRGRWESLTNAHLERAGLDARIDMRSYRAQGIERQPEKKQLPSAWRGEGRSNVIEFRAARIERDQAAADLRRLIPDPAAALADRQAKRTRLEALRAERLAAYTRATQDKAKTPDPVTPAIEQPAAPDFGQPMREPSAAPVSPLERARAAKAEREADREAQRKAREDGIVKDVLPGLAFMVQDRMTRQYGDQRRDRAARVLQRIEAQQSALAVRQVQHEKKAPSKARMLVFGYSKAQAAHQAQAEALERRGADLERRCEVASAAWQHGTTWGEAQVRRDLPRLVELVNKHREAQHAEYKAKVAKREQDGSRGHKGRTR
jgi:hypothetical protein